MKKGLLLGTIAASTAIACAAGFVLANKNGVRFEATKATNKSIVLDGTHGLPDPAGVFESPKSYQITSYTAGGDPIDVMSKAIRSGSGANTSFTLGGDHYLSNYDTSGTSNARLITTIGLHNITSLSISYGTSINQYMSVDVYLYDEDGTKLGSTLDDNTGADTAMTKTFDIDVSSLLLGSEVRKAEIWVIPFMQSDNGTYFIDSISATWSC